MTNTSRFVIPAKAGIQDFLWIPNQVGDDILFCGYYNTPMEQDRKSPFAKASEDKSEIFMLVDGSAIVHRAYHSMPPLTRLDGTPTGAVQGFFSMLLKVIQELNPAHIAIAFDRPSPNFRKELFKAYQSQRPAMESDLSPQFGIIQGILEKAKISQYIVTGDRDMLQLVNHKTKVLAPIKGISEMTLFDAEKVREKYGINPDQFIEMKALMGDASDNYPGVTGIGPKTASALINEYGTVDNIYRNIEKLKVKNAKLAQKLIDGEENARIAHQLATILTDAPFEYSFSDCDIKHLDVESFKKALESYDFKTLPKRLDEVFGKDGSIAKSKMQMKLL